MWRPNRREDGIAIVMVALLLLVFMAFASFAVDFGALYIARRSDQNAADAGSLAGAQSLLSSEAAIASQVIAYAEEDLEATGLNWNSCDADTGKLADIVDGKNCITRDETLLRVKTPPRTINAIFGKALGTSTYEHSAFAIAGLTPEGFGGVLPFGLFTDSSGHVCLRTDNPSTPVSPCNGSATGDTGVLNLGLYGSTLLGTPLLGDCNPSSSGGENSRVSNNIAVGVDHIVARRLNLGQAVLLDTDDCNDKSDPRPNGADTITGAGAMPALAEGLFEGANFSDGGPARLRRTAQVPYQERITVEGIEADNTPLWQFIGTGTQIPTNVPDSCQRSVFTNALTDLSSLPASLALHLQGATREVRMEKLLERCFAHYNAGGTWSDGDIGFGAYPPEQRTGCSEPLAQACSGMLFTRDSVDQEPQIYDIQLTPRFGYVPLVWEVLGSNQVSYRVFRPIFIQRLCIGNQACNQGTFSPGVGWDDQQGSTSTNVHAVSAFAFHPNMLPGGLGGDDAPYDINVNLFLRLVR